MRLQNPDFKKNYLKKKKDFRRFCRYFIYWGHYF